MSQVATRTLDERFWADWARLQADLAQRAPTPADRPALEEALLVLLHVREAHWTLRRSKTLAGAGAIIGLAVDKGAAGASAVYVLRRDGEVQLGWPGDPGRPIISQRLPAVPSGKILGLATYRSYWGGLQAGVVRLEEGQAYLYDILVDGTRLGTRGYELRRQAVPLAEQAHLPLWPQWVGDYPTYRLMVQVEAPLTGGPRRYYLVAQGLALATQDRKWEIPFYPQAVIGDEQAIFIAGRYQGVVRLDPSLKPVAGWIGKVPGSITALACYKGEGDQPWLLVASEEGYLYTLDYATGKLLGQTNLPATPYSLAVGDLEGDGRPEALIGFHDGRLAIYTPPRPAPSAITIDGACDQALRWALQTGPTPADVILGWVAQRRPRLVLEALRRWPTLTDQPLAEVWERLLRQTSSRDVEFILAYYNQNPPNAALVKDLTGYLRSVATELPPAIWRQLSRLPNAADRMPPADPKTQRFTQWIDAQQGVRLIRRCALSAPVTAMAVQPAAGALGTVWLSTQEGQLWVVDLAQRQVSLPARLPSPLVALMPAAANVHAVWGLTADGSLVTYRADVSTPPQQTALPTPLMCAGWTLSEAGGRLLVGGDGGVCLVDDAAGRPDWLLTDGGARHSCWVADANGKAYLALAEPAASHFTLRCLADQHTIQVDLPAPLLRLVAWPLAGQQRLPLVVCADQQIYLFDLNGELRWQRSPEVSGLLLSPTPAIDQRQPGLAPAATFFDLTGNHENELWVTADERVVVYATDGERRGEYCLETAIRYLAVVPLERVDDRIKLRLVVVSAHHELQLFEVLHDPAQREEQTQRLLAELEVLAGPADPVTYWQAEISSGRIGYRVEMALSRLAALAHEGKADSAHRAQHVLTTLDLPADAPTDQHVSLAHALVRLAARAIAQDENAHAALQRVLTIREQYPRLHQSLALQVDRLAPDHLPRPLSPTWLKTLKALVCDDPVTTHGYTCIITSVVFDEKQSDPAWWDVLRALTGAEATTLAYAAARRAVAHRLLDGFRASPCQGWHFMHRLFEGGIHPRVLQSFDPRSAPRLTSRPREQELFKAVEAFMLDPMPERLQALTACLKEVGPDLLTEPCARFYFDLASLAPFEKHDDLEAFFLGGAWSEHFGRYLGAGANEDNLLARITPELEKVLLLLRRGLEEVHGSSSEEKRLDRLRVLASEVELAGHSLKARSGEARAAGHYATAAWLAYLEHLLTQWSRQTGLLGRWIYALSNDFIFKLELADLRFRNEELHASFNLMNVGLATGANLRWEVCQLQVEGNYYAGEWEPAWVDPGPNLEAHKRLTGQLRFVLPPSISATSATLRVEISYIQESRRRKQATVVVTLPTQREAIDYARLFPAAWKEHSAAMRHKLRQPGCILLVELDRTARRPFLETFRAEAPAGISQIVNLRQLYSQLRSATTYEGRPTQLRAEDIHHELARLVTDSPTSGHWGADYRRHFRQALQAPHQAITTLILDRFDYLVLKLLTDEHGREALAEALDFWIELAQNNQVRLILGGSFLTESILRACYPDFMALCEVVRPNYLPLNPAGRREAHAFLEQRLQTTGLDVWLGRFKQPVDSVGLAQLCGYNLLFMRMLALPGLEQARREAEDPTLKRDLSTITLTQYLLEYGHELNFFRMTWVWFDFYDKLALSLLAQAEFSVEKQSWLENLDGMTLTRPYFPGTPRGRSRRAEAQAGDILTPRLIDKVRSSRHFHADDLWLSGFTSRQVVAFGAGEHERVANMLWRLLRVKDQEARLSRLAGENTLVERSAGRELGKLYIWRIPLWREFFVRNQLVAHLVRAALRGEAEWYPRELHLHSRTRQPLYEVQPDVQPVYRAIPLEDWPQLDDAFGDDREERYWGLNFLGLGGQRVAQWGDILALVNNLLSFARPDQTVGDAEVRTLFEHFNRALAVQPAPARLYGNLHHRLTAWGRRSAGWQVTKLGDHILPGLRPYFLTGVIPNGAAWSREDVGELNQQVAAFWKAVPQTYEPENETDKRETRPEVTILIAPQGATQLRQKLEQVGLGPSVRYVVLDKGDLAEILTAPLPSRHLVRLCQRQVGRATLSLYQSRGPLAPGSQLFVGRQEQLKRILELVGRTPALIFGSRRIGKTSLLRQIQGDLEQRQAFLPL